MLDVFHNKYKIASTRLRKWDYSQNGYYFVTICTKDKQHYFGGVIRNKVQLSQIGEIATSCWKNIPVHFPFVELDEYVIMPNHMHGILIIRHKQRDQRRDGACPVSTKHTNSLGDIIGSFKSAVTKYSNENIVKFLWQPRFYDHIIRNEDEYMRIRQYIQANPYNWENDKGESDNW